MQVSIIVRCIRNGEPRNLVINLSRIQVVKRV
jgi:hypothetical protein